MHGVTVYVLGVYLVLHPLGLVSIVHVEDYDLDVIIIVHVQGV